MICYFPEIYEDELLYSWFCRYYAHSGYPHYRTVADELFVAGTTRMDMEFTSPLNEETKAVTSDMYSMQEQILNHTMFNQYARFVDAERRKKGLDALINGTENIHQILPFPLSKNKRELCYCPLCSKEDREAYGETYWHRNHMIRNITICPKHRCRLKTTGIALTGKLPKMFLLAEDLVPEDEDVEFVINEVELSFTDYLIKVFQTPLNMDNNISIGVYLNYQLQQKGYVSELEHHRRVTDLLNEFLELYKDWPVESISKVHQLLKIVTEYRIDFYETCQLAFLLGIPPEEIANPHIPEDSPYKDFNEKVVQIRKTKIKNKHLSDFIGSCNNAIHGVKIVCCNRNQNYSFKTKQYNEKWEKMDNVMLPKVEKLARETYVDKDGKPGKVCKTGITRKMGWPENRTNYLPKCRQAIERYAETYEEFWARKSVWGYKLLMEQKGPEKITLNSFFMLTMIKKANFVKCFPYLSKFTDAETAEAIRALVEQ